MRTTQPFAALAISGALAATPVLAQEHIGVVRQPQTIAPSIEIPQAQAPNCGHAPSAADLNAVVQNARAMFANPAGFDANMGKIAQDACPRSRAAAYLVHLISLNHWKIVR